MHRFYMFHSVTKFCKYKIGIASLFLASKAEDAPIKMEHILIQAHRLFYKNVVIDMKSEQYLKMTDDLLLCENTILMTLGFDLTIEHTHAEVVKGCSMIQASKELASACYLMASNSLHLTTMCLQYSPKVIACFCIHMASKRLNYQIPLSTDGRPWYVYIDRGVTEALLNKLSDEFLGIFDRCSPKLKNAAKRGQIKSDSHQKKQDAVSPDNHNNNPEIVVTRPENDERKVQEESIYPTPPSSQKSVFSPEESYPINSPKEFQNGHHSQYVYCTQYQGPEVSVTQSMPQISRLETDQRQMQRKIDFPTPPFSQKLSFSPEETYPRNESQQWNESQPIISTPSQVPLLLSAASPNLMTPVAGSLGMQESFLKRRASDNLNPSAKRHCNSPDFTRSAKLTEEISSILKTAVISTELDKPNTRLHIENFTAERTLTHQVFMDPPIGILDERRGKQEISIPEDESQTVKVDTSTVQGQSLPNTVEEIKISKRKSKKAKKEKKSKEAKKEKKRNKRDRERRREERRDEQTTDNGTLKSEEEISTISLKIRIPKDRLNLNNDFLLAPESESKSPQNGSLKIKISKKRLNYCDTYSTIPV
ncbi:cyclin-T2-like [Belonocnema kinseyi]|uniref:cyclin-T2-like n=1 Tax=Belonocnema kinseyi TaxID=2817044 RepID=UPI00143D952F|nr:cyclin-T2-like [Belonocnema kinseyi]